MKSRPTTRKSKMSLSRREGMWAYILTGPWIIGFIVFTAGPMIASIFFSIARYDTINPFKFVGLANYAKLFFADPKFWHSLRVTMVYGAVAVPLNLILGLGLALLLNTKVPGISVWRTLYYMPSVVSGVSVAILWRFIFNPRFGIINWLLSFVGIKGPGWLRSPDWALPALIIMSVWSVGGGMIIYLAGLQGIPTALYDAGKVDGANLWQQFLNITLPMMTPVILYNLIIGMISAFQYFTEAFIMTQGGPADATLFYNLYLYNNAFKYLDMGYASALAWVLFFIVLVMTMMVIKSSAAWVYYEGELKGEAQ